VAVSSRVGHGSSALKNDVGASLPNVSWLRTPAWPRAAVAAAVVFRDRGQADLSPARDSPPAAGASRVVETASRPNAASAMGGESYSVVAVPQSWLGKR